MSMFACLSLAALSLSAQTNNQIEPKAGTWNTWVISSGKDYRVPPPPDGAATKAELDWLRLAVTVKDARTIDQINFWDAGSPGYRWLDILASRSEANQSLSPYPVRPFAYLNMAIYDATIAAWDSKYFYNRPRPSDVDSTLRTSLPIPMSPSYPSEHAAAAGAAAAVLSYFYPAEAEYFQRLAEEAARSRLYAGLQYPSDYFAGLELGRKVAAQVIALARADGSGAVWNGTVPTGKCMWVGTNPGNVTAPTWKPILLSSASEFRPPAPPACDSDDVTAQVTAVRQFPRTFVTNYKAFYWQSPEGLNTWPYVFANKWMSEDKVDQNPPRAARAYALLGAAFYDSFIASQDAKFTYWYLRPHQLDPNIVPLFNVPNFPSYPSNHSTFSATRSEMLAYLFPNHADAIRAVGKEAGDSRIWAGIHYEMDNQSGVQLGRSVAQKFITWAINDGSK